MEVKTETALSMRQACELFGRSKKAILADCHSRMNRLLKFAYQDCPNGRWYILPGRYQEALDRKIR